MVGCKSSDVNLNSQSMCKSCHLNDHTTVGSLLFCPVLLVTADGTFFFGVCVCVCVCVMHSFDLYSPDIASVVKLGD